MIRITICEPFPTGSCSYYRSLGPLYKLRKYNSNIEFSQLILAEYTEKIAWNVLANTDILFLQRPTDDTYIRSLELAKDMSVKVWVDFDDNFHEIPEDNPNYENFATEERRNNVTKSLELADIITFSTKALKEYYKDYYEKSYIIENCHNDYNYPFTKKEKSSNIISWRGSNTHKNDLMSCLQEMGNVAGKYKDWGWLFIGGGIDFVEYELKYRQKVEKFSNIQAKDITIYNKLFKKISSAVHICPLLFSLFNECKSNISWIEGTYFGSAVVAPKIHEFEKPGCVNYTESDGSFEYNLERLVKDENFRNKKYEESFEYIQNNLLLSDVNKKRLGIIDRLI